MKIRRLGYLASIAFRNPEMFRALWLSEGVSLQSARRRAKLFELARSLPLNVDGDVIEAGTHKGGTAVVLALALKRQPMRTLHLFDCWGDLPDPTPEDGQQFLDYNRLRIGDKLKRIVEEDPLRACRTLLHSKARIPALSVRYYQGWFRETFQRYDGKPIVLAHIDSDYYESTRLSLQFVKENAADNCVVVVDDYESWDGARRAVDEFCQSVGITPQAFGRNAAILEILSHQHDLAY